MSVTGAYVTVKASRIHAILHDLSNKAGTAHATLDNALREHASPDLRELIVDAYEASLAVNILIHALRALVEGLAPPTPPR